MHNIRKVTEDIVWIGGNDRRLALFENVFPIPEGVSYNSYLLKDEKTVLLDTADSAIAGQFFENLEAALGGRTLDYVVINHMEPDHAALLADVLRRYPKEGEAFLQNTNVWVCTVCGFLFVGDEAPELCPVCAHPKAYFRIKAENY